MGVWLGSKKCQNIRNMGWIRTVGAYRPRLNHFSKKYLEMLTNMVILFQNESISRNSNENRKNPRDNSLKSRKNSSECSGTRSFQNEIFIIQYLWYRLEEFCERTHTIWWYSAECSGRKWLCSLSRTPPQRGAKKYGTLFLKHSKMQYKVRFLKGREAPQKFCIHT